MSALARIGVALMHKKSSIPALLVGLVWALWFLPWAQAEDMQAATEQESGPFIRQTMPGETPIRVAADEVLNAIAKEQDVEIDNAIIEGNLDIMTLIEQLDMDEYGRFIIWGGIIINRTEIRGNTNLSSTYLVGGEGGYPSISFNSVLFNGDLFLSGAVFQKHAEFNATTFGNIADFTDVTFIGNAQFISSTFNGDADFKHASFSEQAFFGSAVFKKNADFSEANMNGATDFSNVTFTDSARFLRTLMSIPANFEGVKYRENTVLSGLWNDVICATVKFLTRSKVNLPKRTVTDFYHFDTGNIMDGSSNPYLKRYIDDEQWIKSWRESIWWRQLIFILWQTTSHCGRSIGLWALWSGIIAFGFGFIYWRYLPDSIAFSISKLVDTKPGLRGYVYYSIVTLTTLGYGDIVPLTNMARLIVGIEVVMGYVMLGGLVSIFATKIATRS